MRRLPSLLLVLVLGALGGAACTAPPPSAAIDDARQAIVGGADDNGDPAVVFLIAQKPGANEAHLCTGTVISAHTVLTAAHCVDERLLGTGMEFTVFLGSSINDNAQRVASNFVDVTRVYAHPQFDATKLEQGNDVGLVVTRTVLRPRPIPMMRRALAASDVGKPLRLVGYGITGGGQGGAGQKRQVRSAVGNFDPRLVVVGQPSANTCNGASGGPALFTENGVEVVLGVTSFGDEQCTQGGVDTRVDAYTAWVDPLVAMAEGSAPPASGGSTTPPSSGSTTGGGGGGGGGSDPSTSGGGSTPTTKADVGAPCDAHDACASGTCLFTGNGRGLCTRRCDPAAASDAATGCPAMLVCGSVDDTPLCVPKVASGGCSVAPGAAQATAAVGGAFDPEAALSGILAIIALSLLLAVIAYLVRGLRREERLHADSARR